jgi:hypothetical protein
MYNAAIDRCVLEKVVILAVFSTFSKVRRDNLLIGYTWLYRLQAGAQEKAPL